MGNTAHRALTYIYSGLLITFGVSLSSACLGIAALNETLGSKEEAKSGNEFMALALGGGGSSGGGTNVGGGAVDSGGNTLTSDDGGITITIPEGAMDDQQKFTITRYSAATNAMPGSFIPTTPVYEITPSYLFKKDVRVSLKLDSAQINGLGLQKTSSTAFSISTTAEDSADGAMVGWNGKDSSVEGDELVFTTRTFSLFGGGTPPPGNRPPDIQGAFYYFKPQTLYLPHRVRARVREWDGDAMSVYLVVGPVGGGTNMISMTADGGRWYRADIPYEAMAAGGIQMQILAVDVHGAVTTRPASSVFQYPADSGNTNYVNNYTRDRDGDGYLDAWEVDNGYNPRNPASPAGLPDADGDGIPDSDDHTPNGEANPVIDNLILIPGEATVDVGETITLGVQATLAGQPRFVNATFNATGNARDGSPVGTMSGSSLTANGPGTAGVTATVDTYDATSSVRVLDSIAPSPITNLTATASSANTVQLRWSAPGNDGLYGNAAIYDIRRSTTPITDDASCGAAPYSGVGLTPKASGLPERLDLGGHVPGTTYYYCIRAADFDGNFNTWTGGTVSAVTPSASDTTPPANISGATATVVDSDTIRLDFSAVGDDGNTGGATAYDIRRSLNLINDDNDCDNALPVSNSIPQTPAGSALSHDVHGLSGNTTYYFCVRAFDAAGNRNSWAQGPLSARTVRANQAPVVTVQVNGTIMVGQSLTLDGTLSYDPDGPACAANPANYTIQWNLVNSPGLSALTNADIVNGNSLNASVTLDAEGNYEFELLFIDEAGSCGPGPRGATGSANVTGLPADVDPPADITFASATALTYDSVRLDFRTVGDDGLTGDVDRYEIGYSTVPITNDAECSAAAVFLDPGITDPSGTLVSYGITGLVNQATYHFCIRAYDEVGNVSQWTFGALTATTPEGVNGWSAWGAFGSCSATCAGGTMSQTRTCLNPANGCAGSDTNTVSCNTQACQTTYWNSGYFAHHIQNYNCPAGYHVQSVGCSPGNTAYEQFDWFPDPFACGALSRGGYNLPHAVTNSSGQGTSTANCTFNHPVPFLLIKCQRQISHGGEFITPFLGVGQWFWTRNHQMSVSCIQTP